MRRLLFVRLALLPCLALALFAAACGGPGRQEATSAGATQQGPRNTVRSARRRVVVLVFDGADPDLVDRWKLELPAIASILGSVDCPRFGTTLPPDTAPAWSSLATGLSPEHHGVWGRVTRDPASHAPISSILRYAPHRLDAQTQRPLPPTITNLRKGAAFWEIAEQAGLSVRGFFLPYALPAVRSGNGAVLAGIGVPDLRLSESTFFLLDSALTAEEARKVPVGGIPVPMTRDGAVYKADIAGPFDTDGNRVTIQLTFDVNLKRGTVLANVGRAGAGAIEFGQGELSRPMHLDFPVNGTLYGAHTRFLIQSMSDERLRLYMGPLMMDARSPYFDFSSPPERAGQLAEAMQFTRTLGASVDTEAYEAGLLPDDVFWKEIEESFKDQLRIFMTDFSKGDADLVVGYFQAVNLGARYYGRHAEADAGSDVPADLRERLLKTYRWMDEAVARVQPELKPDDTLFLVSGHGMVSWERSLNLNAWLVQEGFLKLEPEVRGAGSRSREDRLPLRDRIDWSRTQAWSIGAGQIFLNVAGREARGIVRPEDAPRLAGEIADLLAALRDPAHPDAEPLRSVARRESWETGKDNARPDLRISMAPGYQPEDGWNLPPSPSSRVFEDNRRRWTWAHAGSDPRDVEGIAVVNLPGFTRGARLEDLAPTLLARLGVSVPAGLDGQDRVAYSRGGGATRATETRAPQGGEPSRSTP